ncbi:Amylosucrase [Botrimarina colliarenosi]|uniref:Amylosucrase n=2 Tax=Botrimarina colliarenosi TaxID=2528001 RepID=A0A5C6AIZ5_9BACT|nr:Amylosucrase [Botrimarina colliarenosi]
MWESFKRRLESQFEALFAPVFALYGDHYDFFFHLETIVQTITEAWIEREGGLCGLDALREEDRSWFQSHRMVGATCYVDLFAGGFKALGDHLPYLKELGITYLHLMPIFRSPEGEDDGGYAVSDYRNVDPKLGTVEELREVATLFRQHGISLALDFVLNHTADEHEWAKRALDGDPNFQAYYRMFPDRELPDAYERNLHDVFPDDHDGAFSYRPRIKQWVWTTFHTYQWDLNYANPALLRQMTEEMLFLANLGVEVIRMDAVAFLWKELGTDCQNLPHAHDVLRVFSAAARIAAPATTLKSEAIVHPDEVRKYIHMDECQLSYNPQLMALLWDALATRKTTGLRVAMERRFQIDPGCAWVNYVRCHDDIGWAFSDEEVEAAGFDPRSHRRFLTKFYTGQHEGSFSRGLVFQENPETGDARVSGMTASLAGLEHAIEIDDPAEIELAIRRIVLLHGVIMTIGGMPLIYLGDEIAMLNDYGFEDDREKYADSRWVHRPPFDWERSERRHDNSTPEGRVYQSLQRLIQLRTQSLAFDRAETEFVDVGNEHVFAFFRNRDEHSALIIANFSENPQSISAKRLRNLGLRKTVVDTFKGEVITAGHELDVEPYQLMVLATGSSHAAARAALD